MRPRIPVRLLLLAVLAPALALLAAMPGWFGGSPAETVQAASATGAFSQVSTGYLYTCGLRTDGTLACWGKTLTGRRHPPPAPSPRSARASFTPAG